MPATHEEWLKQADYDMDTAEFMLEGGRGFYAVFMCHLVLEKAIKSLYQFHRQKTPPRTHNLTRLLDQTGRRPPVAIDKFLLRLSEASVATRYPDTLAALESAFNRSATAELLRDGKEAMEWIKKQF